MPPKDNREKTTPFDPSKPDDNVKALDERDIAILKGYSQGPYFVEIKKAERNIQDTLKRVDERVGVKEADTGLAPPNLWDIAADKRRIQEEQTLQVARCTKIINKSDEQQYIINVKQIGKFVVGPGKKVAPADIEEGMRVG